MPEARLEDSGSGLCALLVENEERRLRAWDFFHAPGWTEHALWARARGRA